MKTSRVNSIYKAGLLAVLLAFVPNLIILAQGYGPYRTNNSGGYYNQGYRNGGGCANRNNGYYNQGYGSTNGYNPNYGYNNGGYSNNGPAYGYSQQPQGVIVIPPQPQVVIAPPVAVQRPPIIVGRPRPWDWGDGYYAHHPRFYGGNRW